MKKKIGITIVFLTLVIVSSCYSTIGENVHQVTIMDNYDVTVSYDENTMIVYPHETAVYCIEVTNTGTITDTYILDCPDLIDCCYWSELTTYGLNLSPGETGITVLTVTPYWEVEDTYKITVQATSTSDPTVYDSVPTFTDVILGDRVIEVTTDKPVYNPGEPVTLSIINIDQETIEGNPEFEVFNEDGEVVFGCYPDCWIPLEPGESFDCFWEPNVPQGKYVVEGRFTTYTDTYEDDETFFIFNENQIDVATDKLGYNSGEIVSLMITNIGPNIIEGNPSFDIFDSEGDVVFSLRIYLWIELEPGETWSWEWDQEDNQGQQVPDGRYLLEGHLNKGDDTYIDHALFYIGENNPPDIPTITGKTLGKPGVEYEYTFITTDPDGDDIWYYICWGDKEIIYIYGPYHSGEEIKLSYTWEKAGTYTITCKARDMFDAESEWGTLTVTMSRNRAIVNPLLKFLENHPNLFPILQLFSQLLGL